MVLACFNQLYKIEPKVRLEAIAGFSGVWWGGERVVATKLVMTMLIVVLLMITRVRQHMQQNG